MSREPINPGSASGALRLTCLACGQANRVPAARLAEAPRCAICGTGLTGGKPADLDPATLAKASRDDLPLLVEFWAPWCGPCRAMAPEFVKAGRELGSAVRLAKLDTQSQPKAAQSHRIQGIPALILFWGGRERLRLAGLRPASQLVREIRAALPKA